MRHIIKNRSLFLMLFLYLARNMATWIENTYDCRPQRLYLAMDGIGECCLEMKSAALCDICQAQLDSLRTSSSVAVPNLQPPPPPVPQLVERAQHVQAVSLSLSRLAQDVKRIVELIGQHCVFCYLFKADEENHPYGSCAVLTGRCFRCMSATHGTSTCTHRLWDGPRYHCYKCQLPKEIDGVLFHSEANRFGNACQNLNRETLSMLCLFEIFVNDNSIGLGISGPIDYASVHRFLTRPNLVVPEIMNYIVFAVEIFRKYIDTRS